MANPSERIESQLPKHYKEYYPRFIKFIQCYYDWLHRGSGLSASEVDALKADTSWLKTNIDSFIETGSLKNIENSDVETAIIQMGLVQAPGNEVDMMVPYHMLDNISDEFITADGEYYATSAGENINSNDYSDDEIDSWLDTLGYSFTTDITNLNPVDRLLLVRLLKHIYNIKGTEKSIELFFSMYFGETVQVYYPKNDIAVIDDNFVLDDLKYIRDDDYYNEYSYVIKVQQDPSVYQDLFNKVYLKHIHPAGFKVFLIKV